MNSFEDEGQGRKTDRSTPIGQSICTSDATRESACGGEMGYRKRDGRHAMSIGNRRQNRTESDRGFGIETSKHQTAITQSTSVLRSSTREGTVGGASGSCGAHCQEDKWKWRAK